MLFLWIITAPHSIGQGFTAAALLSPTPGSTLGGATQTFSWSAGVNVTYYWLDVGYSLGQGDIYATGSYTSTATSASVSGLPTNGSTLYVRLWSYANGVWQTPYDYTLTAYYSTSAFTRATLTSPTPNSVLSGSTQTFSWSAGTNVTYYWLDVGTTFGQGNIWATGSFTSTATSANVTGLPTNGSTLYVRLWSYANGAWQTPYDYTLTAYSSSFTRATLTSPTPNSVLNGSTQTFYWSAGTNVTYYWLDVGTSLGLGNIYATGSNTSTATSANVIGLPTNGSTLYVRLWSYANGAWQTPYDYTVTAAVPPPVTTYRPTAIGPPPSGSCVLTADPPVYAIQRVNGNQINVSATMAVNGPVQGNWQVYVQLFVYFNGTSFGHGIPDTQVSFSPATQIGTGYGPAGSVLLEPRGSGEYWLRAVTWGVCNGQRIDYGGAIGDSVHFPVQRPTVFVPDSNGNPTGLTSADFWYLDGAPSTDGYYTQYRLGMNPNTTPGQGTYSYSWVTNDNSKLDLTPESPTRVIITSKGASSPGFPPGEITVKASLNGFTSLAFQVRINTPNKLRLGNDGAPVHSSCSAIYGAPAYVGFESAFLYNILDMSGAPLAPIVTHETLENRKVVTPDSSPSNWQATPARGTWFPNNGNHWMNVGPLTFNASAFVDNYRACIGPTFIELTPTPFDPTPNAPTSPVVNFTQKYWVGTTTPESTNTFTGKCVQRNIALLKRSVGSAESVVSPATPTQCAAGAVVN